MPSTTTPFEAWACDASAGGARVVSMGGMAPLGMHAQARECGSSSRLGTQNLHQAVRATCSTVSLPAPIATIMSSASL